MERLDAFDGQLDRVAHGRIDRYVARYDEDVIDRDSIEPRDLLAHERIAARANAGDHLARHAHRVLVRGAAPRLELAQGGVDVAWERGRFARLSPRSQLIAQHSSPP